ncbi:transposase [Streptomyces sp. NPDC001070]
MRRAIADAQWARSEPLLPDRMAKRGSRWRDHRQVIEAIAVKLYSSTQWVHLPERYGNRRGAFNAPVARVDADEGLPVPCRWTPPSCVADQHTAGARKKGSRPASHRLRHRPVPQLTDDEDPSCGRWSLPAPRVRSHRWPGRPMRPPRRGLPVVRPLNERPWVWVQGSGFVGRRGDSGAPHPLAPPRRNDGCPQSALVDHL